MDIGSINRIKTALPSAGQIEIRRNNNATPDRDTSGQAFTRQEKPTRLTPEQEDQAVSALNEMPSFLRSGLKAAIVREDGSATHIVVRDNQGQILRRMDYEQIVDLYLNRHMEKDTGLLLRRAA